MNFEDDYAEEMAQIKKRALEKEKVWIDKNDDNGKLGTKKPSDTVGVVDYRGMGWKSSSTYQSHNVCTRCESTDIYSTRICAGCRRNGDGYGSYVYMCNNCGLFDWESYDEA